MKKLILGTAVLAALLFGTIFIYAAPAENSISQEISEGKQLVDSRASCSSLSSGQLEAIGEYIMEQMHPGASHELMHQMMGIQDGTPEHEAVHIQMAEMMYCGNSAGTTANGLSYTGMMGGYMSEMMASMMGNGIYAGGMMGMMNGIGLGPMMANGVIGGMMDGIAPAVAGNSAVGYGMAGMMRGMGAMMNGNYAGMMGGGYASNGSSGSSGYGCGMH